MTKHDFTGKSIKCDTWEQMEHLAKLAEEQHNATSYLGGMYFNQDDFNSGDVYFVLDPSDNTYLIQSVVSAINKIETTYSDFINTLPTEVVEVIGCEDCPMYTKLAQHDYQYCAYPNNQQSCQMHVDMFKNCPLKKSSLTIKLKQNEPTGN